MITQNTGSFAGEAGGTSMGANAARFRSRNAADIPGWPNKVPPVSIRRTETLPPQFTSETKRLSARTKKPVDCGELFRSWALRGT